jgi:predicted nucleic acid-binding protein
MALLDANVILRFITKDNPDHSPRAYALLKELESGARSLTITEAVVVEVVYVLAARNLYNLPRDEIKTHLSAVLSLRGLRLTHKATHLRALGLFVAHRQLSFVDALNVAHLERLKVTEIVSFDRGYDRVPGVTRQEP